MANLVDKLMNMVSTANKRTVKYRCCAYETYANSGFWCWSIEIDSLQVVIKSKIIFSSKKSARDNMALVIKEVGWEIPDALR